MRGTAIRWGLAIVAVAAVAAAVLAATASHGGDTRLASASAVQDGPSGGVPLPVSLMAGERILTGLESPEVTPALRSAVAGGRLAGVVLYGGCFPTRAAGRRLTAALRAIQRPAGMPPLLILTDQEGGQVKRFDGAPDLSAWSMGKRGPVYSRAQGRRTAANLRGLGIDVDLAPDLDLARPGTPTSHYERGFGTDGATVAASGVAFARGLRDGGVAAVAKHFPGLGGASGETDLATQDVPLSAATLWRQDERPYRAFAAAGGQAVMMSTAIYPALAPVPAVFSRRVIEGELRGRIGFRGVVLTDALGTPAAQAYGDPARAALAAVRAGADLLLFTDLSASESARRAVLAKLRGGGLDTGRFEESTRRVLDLAASL